MAGPEEVWALKTDPDALVAEFRPFGYFSLSDTERSMMRAAFSEASSCALRLRIPPFGFEWPMNIDVVENKRVYRDRSSNRLYEEWSHYHRIEPSSDGALYVDEVVFVSALPMHKWVAKLTKHLFVHRHKMAARRLPTEFGTVGVAMLRLDEPSP
jgi:ligand-binding SRPBCC domain-containing protein